MGLRPTKGDEDAAGRFRAINNLHRVFNGAFACIGIRSLARSTRKPRLVSQPLANGHGSDRAASPAPG